MMHKIERRTEIKTATSDSVTRRSDYLTVEIDDRDRWLGWTYRIVFSSWIIAALAQLIGSTASTSVLAPSVLSRSLYPPDEAAGFASAVVRVASAVSSFTNAFSLFAIAVAILIRFGWSRRTAQAAISAGGASIRVDGVDIEFARVREYWLDASAKQCIELKNGRILRLVGASEGEREELVALLDATASGHRSTTSLGRPVLRALAAGAAIALSYGGFVLLSQWPIVAVLESVGEALKFSIHVAVIVLTLIIVAAILLSRGVLELGADGIVIRRWYRKRYTPFRSIRRVRAHGADLVLERVNSRPVRLKLRGPVAVRAARARALEARIAAMLHPHDQGDISNSLLGQLSQGGRSFTDWHAHLAGLFATEVDYRTAASRFEEIGAVITDPTREADLRVAAAVVLSARDREAARSQVRIAVERTVDEDLKALLERAAEGEIVESALKRVRARR